MRLTIGARVLDRESGQVVGVVLIEVEGEQRAAVAR